VLISQCVLLLSHHSESSLCLFLSADQRPPVQPASVLFSENRLTYQVTHNVRLMGAIAVLAFCVPIHVSTVRGSNNRCCLLVEEVEQLLSAQIVEVDV